MPERPPEEVLDTARFHRPHTWNLHSSVVPITPFLLKPVDYISFPRILGEFVKVDPQFTGVLYTEDFPTATRPQTSMVTYRLIKRVPGMDKIATRKPRLRFSYKNDDQTIIEIWSQWMTCIYQFDIIASTSQEADDLLYKFDWFIRHNVGVFLSMGVSELVFEEQLEDHLLPNTEDLIVRSIRWLARLENLEYRTTPVFNQAIIRVFEPQEQAVEALVRGPDLKTVDALKQTFVSAIAFVSNPASGGTEGMTSDYSPNVDFLILYNSDTHTTALQWLEPGRNPAPGATYYVRYSHWTAFSRLRVPYY